METFPKTVSLRDGKQVTLRPMVMEDEAALLAFFQKMPNEDLMFLMDNVTNPALIRRWAEDLDYDRVLPILAFDGTQVVANATLHRSQSGLFRHVGEIRCMVHPQYRGNGLASQVAGELFRLALHLGVELIQARILEDQTTAAKLFETLGLRRTAILPNYAKDSRGARHNVILMISDTDELWQKYTDFVMDLDAKHMY